LRGALQDLSFQQTDRTNKSNNIPSRTIPSKPPKLEDHPPPTRSTKDDPSSKRKFEDEDEDEESSNPFITARKKLVRKF
jgi:hypothetical protein